MGLRKKILSGFLILAIMLFIAGLWSIYELNKIGSSVKRILDENYQSIYAAKIMKESLEREDSAILLLMLGKWKEGRTILNAADSTFEIQYKFAIKNISIPGENEHLLSIKSEYDLFKKLWERPIVDTDKAGNINWYFKEVHKSFLAVKKSVNDLISLNDRIMYQTASQLENRANRAIMPGIVAIISALIFTLIFNYLVNYFMVNPIITITERIKKFREKRTPYDVRIETKDEIRDLSDAIQNLCQSLSHKENFK
jgi:methyl-accepting chemotaxis protein